VVLLAIIYLARLLELGPVEASLAGAKIAGAPGLASELLDICEAESGCTAVSIHRGKLRRVQGRVFYRKARAAGLLDDCPAHALGDGDRWGIRGAHGLAAAYSVYHLGECVPPEAIDIPLMSAIVTARRLGELATRYRRRTAASRAHAWRHGVGCRCDGSG
jgi:hypothetical protein